MDSERTEHSLSNLPWKKLVRSFLLLEMMGGPQFIGQEN